MTNVHFDLKFASDWSVIDPARELVSAIVTARLADREVASQVGVVAYELMENAMKYSSDATAHVQLEVTPSGEVQLIVENPIRSQDVPHLLAEVSAASQAGDPLAFYQCKMVESLSRTDGGSGLGLARIRFESRMSLSCAVADGLARVSCVHAHLN
jgi:hypothetical protein